MRKKYERKLKIKKKDVFGNSRFTFNNHKFIRSAREISISANIFIVLGFLKNFIKNLYSKSVKIFRLNSRQKNKNYFGFLGKVGVFSFFVLFLVFAIMTSKKYGLEDLKAVIIPQNFTQDTANVNEGIMLLKYENRSEEYINSKTDFDSGEYTSENFEVGKDDLIAISDSDDYLTLEHYGDNPPDTSELDWWYGGQLKVCSANEFNNGTYSDTQWDGTNNWIELDNTGLTNGTGEYVSEIMDAGNDIAWSNFAWISSRPTFKELPDNKGIETAYNAGNIDMSENEFLMHLNESSGDVHDSSGNGFTGTLGSATTLGADGKFNTALDFTGDSNGEVVIDDSSHPLNYTDVVSYGVWFKARSFRNWAGLLSRMSTWPSYGGGGYNLQVGTVQKIACGSGVYTNSNNMPVTGQWYHAVCVYDGTQMKLYVNGELQNDVDTITLTESTANEINIGEFYTNGSSLDFDGQIDEAFITHKALSAQEVEDMYRRGANRLKFQVRSCDDDACSGENFVGPDGTGSTYYSEEADNSVGLPCVSLSAISDNRYFQFRTEFETDDSAISPDLSCVTINKSSDNQWKYRRCFDVDNTNSNAENLEEYQIYLDIDTEMLVSDGKMQSDGSDIRFVDEDGDELSFFIADDMNTDSTRVWVQLDKLDSGNTQKVCMYYGNDSGVNTTSSRDDVFTYLNQKDIYYVVSDKAKNSKVEFVSYHDNNHVTFSVDYDDTLNQYESDLYPSSADSLSQTTIIQTKAPINGGYQTDTTDNLVPASYAGTKFVYRMDRGTNKFSIFSPWCDASVKMENDSGNIISGSPFSVSEGTAINVTTNNSSSNGVPDNSVIIIEEDGDDCPIVVTHHATDNYDSFVMYPASNEWYGVGSGYIEIAAMEDSTSVTLYDSSGSTNTYSLSRGDELYISGGGSEGSAYAHRVVSDKPIGVKSLADSDGVESTTFLPPNEMGYKYYLPEDIQYIAIATQAGKTTTVDLYNDGTNCGVGTPDDTHTITASSPYPGKVYFGSTSDGTHIGKGACVVSDHPIFLYYEYASESDEHNAWSEKQNRQFVYGVEYSVGTEQTGMWSIDGINTWTKRTPITITNNSSLDISEYQIGINVNSEASWIFTGSQSDGGDIRVAGSSGDGTDNIDYGLEEYNSSSSEGYVWIKFDSVSSGSSDTAYIYYNTTSSLSTTGDYNDIFITNDLKGNYYVVDSRSAQHTLNAISFNDNNSLNYGTSTQNFDEGEIISAPFSTISQNDKFAVTAPLHIGFDSDSNDSAIPISYAGTEFVYRIDRNNDVFSFYAPFADANVEIQQSSGSGWTTLQTINITTNTAVTVPRNITNNRAFKIVSDEPILAFHRNDTYDSKILYPTHLAFEENSGKYELYGVGTSNLELASSSDANVTIYRSDGSSASITLSASNNFVYEENGGGAQGTARGYHIVSDVPIGATSLADADGGETVVFVSQKEFSKEYVLSNDAQYFSIVARDPNVTCRVYDDAGNEITSGSSGMDNVPPQTGGSNTMPHPNRIHIGGDDTSDGAFFFEGYRMECDEPVYAFYEHHVAGLLTDETSWLTWPQVRQRAYVEPDVEDLDNVDEEGLYYESGTDSTTTNNDFEAYAEYIIDNSSDTYGKHTYWRDVDWEEIVNSRSGGYNVEQIEYMIAGAHTSSDCTSVTYTNYKLLDNLDTISSSADNSLSYVTYNTNRKVAKIPDELSDFECLSIRAYIRTADQAYAPRLNNFRIGYYIPTLLNDQRNHPKIVVNGATSGKSETYRILKAITNDTGLANSQVFGTYNGSSDESVFSNADLYFYELSNDDWGTQFDFPPFPASTPEESNERSLFDSSNSIAVYFEHERSSGSDENMDFTFNVDINSSGGPRISRDFRLDIGG